MSTDERALSHDELAALRRAAALAHAVGAIELTLHAGSTVVAQVVPGAGGDGSPVPARTLDPCRFRAAVGRAWADHSAGRAITVAGLATTNRLHVAWSVAAPGALLGFDAVRAPCGGRTIWAFASLLAPDELGPALGEIPCGGGGSMDPAPPELAAHLVHDELLGVTLVHVETDEVQPATMFLLDEVLYRMLAASAAAEIELSCSTGSRPSSGR